MKVLIAIALLLTGCQTIRITDPATKITYESRTFLMKQGPKDITVKDGAREVIVKTGEKDQTAIGQKLIDLGASLK
jgi:hypothetical protein